MSSFLHGQLDVTMEVRKELGSGSGHVLTGEVSTAVGSLFEKDVFQLQDDGDHIVLFTVWVFLSKVRVHAVADFFQFGVMPDDLIELRVAVAQKFRLFHIKIDYSVLSGISSPV